MENNIVGINTKTHINLKQYEHLSKYELKELIKEIKLESLAFEPFFSNETNEDISWTLHILEDEYKRRELKEYNSYKSCNLEHYFNVIKGCEIKLMQ